MTLTIGQSTSRRYLYLSHLCLAVSCLNFHAPSFHARVPHFHLPVLPPPELLLLLLLLLKRALRSLQCPHVCVRQKRPPPSSLAQEAERCVWILCCPCDPSTAGPPAAGSLSSACPSPKQERHNRIMGTLHTCVFCYLVCPNMYSLALSRVRACVRAHTHSLTNIKQTQYQDTCQLAADSETSSLGGTQEASSFSATREEDGLSAPEMSAPEMSASARVS